MQHRQRSGCLNPYKHHLWRLPDIPVERQPKAYPGASQACVAVFPLFQSTSEDDVSLEHHLVRAACWGRRSWLLYSDAVKRDVKVGFYIEESVYERCVPLLEASGIDVDTEVFLFDGSLFLGDPRTHLGKKLSIFCDDQFSAYDWVVQLDADMWLGSPHRKSFPFFHYVSEHEPGIGAVTVTSDQLGRPPYPNIEDRHYWWSLLDDGASDAEKVDAWILRARKVAGECVSAFMDPDAWVWACHGGIYAASVAYLSNHQDRRDWIMEAARELQDDEAVFSLWRMLGYPLFSIAQETGIPFIGHMEDLVELREGATSVYFSHPGNNVAEWFWREDADAL